MSHQPSPPALLEALERLTAFLPVFEDERFVFGTWSRADVAKHGSVVMPYFRLSGPAQRFVEAAYAYGWVLPEFDWPSWSATPAGRNLMSSPAALETATSGQLAQLLTAIIRGDRFTDGTLNDAYQKGVLVGILRRAEVLRAELAR